MCDVLKMLLLRVACLNAQKAAFKINAYLDSNSTDPHDTLKVSQRSCLSVNAQ